MRTTVDYMIGNTAIQIINKGNKIKIVDVEKEKVRKSTIKHLIVALMAAGLLIASCFYVVRLENQKVMLNKEVYTLQTEVDNITKENMVLRKEEENLPIDYDVILKRALALGMHFPTNQQIEKYAVEKSTVVRASLAKE